MRGQAELQTGIGHPSVPSLRNRRPPTQCGVLFLGILSPVGYPDPLSESQSKATGNYSYPESSRYKSSPFFPKTVNLILSHSSPGQHSAQSTSHSVLPSLKLWFIARWKQDTVSCILSESVGHCLTWQEEKLRGELARKSRSGHTFSFTFLLLCVPNTTNSISSVHLDKKELSA